MAVNLKDIAESLNLSVSTVSRALNNQGRINPKTRARVLKVMEQMDYHPNEAARALRQKSSHTLGVVVPDIANAFFAQLIKGAERSAWSAGYELLVMSGNEEIARERQSLRYMIDKHVAGIVLATIDPNCPAFPEATRQEIPVVFVDNLPALTDSFDSVAIDNRRWAYQLTRRLIELGHTHVALLNGNIIETSAAQRQAGYEQAMAEAGLTPVICAKSFSRDYAIEATAALISASPRPTALLAANNHLAYGAMEALREARLSVPKDISLCCFDAWDSTGLLLPRLTSVNQPAERFGTVAVDILLRKIQSDQSGLYERLILEPEVEWGSSIARPVSCSPADRP